MGYSANDALDMLAFRRYDRHAKNATQAYIQLD